MRTALVLFVIFCVGFCGGLQAQEQHGFEIGGYAGASNWKGRNFQVNLPQTTAPINLGYRYDNKPLYGVRVNLLSQRHWGGELEYSYQKNTASLTRDSFTPVALEGGVHQFFYNTVFYPNRYESSTLVPFVMAGIGVAGYQLSSDTRAKAADPRGYGIGNLLSIDKRFAFDYGGGVKARVQRHVGVRLDFRHIFSDVPSYGLPKESTTPSQVVLPIQGKLQHFEVTGGIYFHVWK